MSVATAPDGLVEYLDWDTTDGQVQLEFRLKEPGVCVKPIRISAERAKGLLAAQSPIHVRVDGWALCAKLLEIDDGPLVLAEVDSPEKLNEQQPAFAEADPRTNFF